MLQETKKVLANLRRFDIIIVVVVVVRQSQHLLRIAQLVEHFTRNEGVVGSNPISSFFLYRYCI